MATKNNYGFIRTKWSAAVSLALALAAFTPLVAKAQIARLLPIPSAVPWTDTGIDITAGSRLIVEAKGKVIYYDFNNASTDANGGNWDGRMFFPNAVLPNAVIVSLIGKIGGSTGLYDGAPVPAGVPVGGPGFVGVSYNQVIPESGRLFLGFNDTPNAFGDNIGSFQVSITVVPPAQSTNDFVSIQDQFLTSLSLLIPIKQGGNSGSSSQSQSVTTLTASTVPQSVNISTYAGLEIQGYANQTCGIQYCTNLSAEAAWLGLTNIVPDTDDYIWVDTTTPANSGQRFFRVVPGPISIP